MDFTDDEVKKILKRRRTLSRRRYFYFKWLESLISTRACPTKDATLPAAGNVAGRPRRLDQSIYGRKTMDASHDENKAQPDQLRSSSGGDMLTVIAPKTGAEATSYNDDHDEARHNV